MRMICEGELTSKPANLAADEQDNETTQKKQSHEVGGVGV